MTFSTFHTLYLILYLFICLIYRFLHFYILLVLLSPDHERSTLPLRGLILVASGGGPYIVISNDYSYMLSFHSLFPVKNCNKLIQYTGSSNDTHNFLTVKHLSVIWQDFSSQPYAKTFIIGKRWKNVCAPYQTKRVLKFCTTVRH